MSSYDLNDPVGRFRAAEALGPDGYNRAMKEHLRKSVVATVNGYDIRRVQSGRFGTIYMIDGANVGYPSLERSKQHAAGLPQKEGS